MYTIIFRPENGGEVKVRAEKGESILELALANGVAVDSPCSGNGTCGKCRMRLISGAVEMERSPRLSKDDYRELWRLACQSRVSGDAVFLVPAAASAFKTDIRTADLGSPEELARYEHSIDALFSAGMERGCAESGVGVAMDIGTTTVTAAMLDLASGKVLSKASLGNGQIQYGADVINRIIQSSRTGGRDKLRRAVLDETAIPIFDRLCADAFRSAEDIKRVVIAGNTTMEHLFVGANAETIRLEPYEPEFLELCGKTAGELRIPADPAAPVILAPNVGSYVGGDITAGVLASRLWDSEELTLFIDLGTNGELVFGNSEYMLCCACSAGPAFEGGDISCGMRATDGAIEDVTIDPETLTPTLSVIGEGRPAGLCGSGLIAVISELFRCGAISAKGRFIKEDPRIRYDEYGGASYVVAYAHESATGHDIELDESDLDNFIRAKAAIFSAVRTMLKSLDMTVEDVDRVILAGGIGSGIDIEKAISIGMLPKLPPEKYSYIGNSSLTGACAMLLSDAAEEKTFELGRSMTYIELSTEAGYMDEFVAACFLPHTDRRLFE